MSLKFTLQGVPIILPQDYTEAGRASYAKRVLQITKWGKLHEERSPTSPGKCCLGNEVFLVFVVLGWSVTTLEGQASSGTIK